MSLQSTFRIFKTSLRLSNAASSAVGGLYQQTTRNDFACFGAISSEINSKSSLFILTVGSGKLALTQIATPPVLHHLHHGHS